MLIDAILKLHAQVQGEKLGPHRLADIEAKEQAAMTAVPTSQMKGLLR
jgi:NADH-quinone oxidoreductase subunit B